MIDKPDANFTKLNAYRNIKSYSQAFNFLNDYANTIFKQNELNIYKSHKNPYKEKSQVQYLSN